jgi:hypothetical protein
MSHMDIQYLRRFKNDRSALWPFMTMFCDSITEIKYLKVPTSAEQLPLGVKDFG